jgi:hypothetical protein
MTTLIGEVRARVIASSHARYFYFYMALSCIAVAFLVFAPTYGCRWLPAEYWRSLNGERRVAFDRTASEVNSPSA